MSIFYLFIKKLYFMSNITNADWTIIINYTTTVVEVLFEIYINTYPVLSFFSLLWGYKKLPKNTSEEMIRNYFLM